MSSRPIRILIIGDHPVFCIGLTVVFDQAEDMRTLGYIRSSADIQKQIKTLQPELVILDCYLSEVSSKSLVATIREHVPGMPVLALSPIIDRQHIKEMLSAGVMGYLLKTESPETILTAARAIVRGELRLSPNITAFVSVLASGEEPSPIRLTERERQVLHLIARGKENAQIAEALYISLGTVKNHVVNVYSKLGVHNRVEAVLWALQHEI
jgi:NarL family two-component system response regulator LiaR